MVGTGDRNIQRKARIRDCSFCPEEWYEVSSWINLADDLKHSMTRIRRIWKGKRGQAFSLEVVI
jgi:hypothetical protein